jgi:transcriptional regulator MraZ
VFLGEFQHTLDAKGRIFLPHKFRGRLEGGLFLAKGQDRCLYIFSMEGWSEYLDELRVQGLTGLGQRDFERLLFSGASEQAPDKQGRIAIPETLRSYAGLQKDVAVIGVGKRVEVWDGGAWEQRRGQAERSYADL